MQRYLVGTHEIGLQKMGSRAATLAFNEVYGMGYADHARYASRILGVTSLASRSGWLVRGRAGWG